MVKVSWRGKLKRRVSRGIWSRGRVGGESEEKSEEGELEGWRKGMKRGVDAGQSQE